MKATTYHKQVIKYLLKHGKAKNGSQIARAFKNYDNRGLYIKALNTLEGIEKDQDGYKLMPEYIAAFGIIPVNSGTIDLMMSNKKMSFIEWFLKFHNLGIDMTKSSEFQKVTKDEVTKLFDELLKETGIRRNPRY